MTARIVAMATHIGTSRNETGAAIETQLDEVGMAVTVALTALSQLPAGTSLSFIIFACSGIRHVFPSAAARIAKALRQNCVTFDITAGCTSLGTAVQLASRLDGTGLVVGADNLSRTISPDDPAHRPLRSFADGAAALVISHDADHGHRILAAAGQTHPAYIDAYASTMGKLRRQLPHALKDSLRQTYVSSWASITRTLLRHLPGTTALRLYANQGDQIAFAPLVEALKPLAVDIVQTTHGHAGGADPWIGLARIPPPDGGAAVLLSSGIGFHFHGVLLGAL